MGAKHYLVIAAVLVAAYLVYTKVVKPKMA